MAQAKKSPAKSFGGYKARKRAAGGADNYGQYREGRQIRDNIIAGKRVALDLDRGAE